MLIFPSQQAQNVFPFFLQFFKLMTYFSTVFAIVVKLTSRYFILIGTNINVIDFPGGSVVKNTPPKQETQIQSVGQEDALQKEKATHSSILVWEISWREEPGGLQSMGSQRGEYDLVTKPPPLPP